MPMLKKFCKSGQFGVHYRGKEILDEILKKAIDMLLTVGVEIWRLLSLTLGVE